MRALVAVLLAHSSLVGCAFFPRYEELPQTPGEWVVSPAGNEVRVPDWLLSKPGWLEETLKEVDESTPMVDDRLPPLPDGLRGPPRGVKVVIRDPGYYSYPSSTGYAAGHTDMRTYIHVAYASPPQRATPGRRMPAFRHELAHCYYELVHDVGEGANHK